MYKCEREDEIMALLSENEYATVEFLSRKMNISPSSIRRDSTDSYPPLFQTTGTRRQGLRVSRSFASGAV